MVNPSNYDEDWLKKTTREIERLKVNQGSEKRMMDEYNMYHS